MKKLPFFFISLIIVALSSGNAGAFSHANAFGGHSSWGGGSWSHVGARGGTASGGGGHWSATGAEGGHAQGIAGVGSTATGRYGTTAVHGYGSGTTKAY